ncbi:MAG TPA: hypothetical protein VFQ20_08290 [Burkholderiaceae bacterium]|nr:hypothetical protein [Burkholderiaceae bacterium]
MTAIRIEQRKAPADAPATSAPPEWKWDALPVLKEVIETDAPSPDEGPTVEDSP